MFLWISLHTELHPNFTNDHHHHHPHSFHASDIETSIAARAFQKGVQITKGSLFADNSKSSLPRKAYLRLTYAAAASESELQKGVELVVEAIKEEYGIL